MLANREWDRDYLKAKAEFNKLKTSKTSLNLWASPEHATSPQANNIRNILNDYELTAIGIREGILDEELYRRWFKTSFLRDFDMVESYISEVRKKAGTSKIYAEFEWLANRWKEEKQPSLPLETSHRKQA